MTSHRTLCRTLPMHVVEREEANTFPGLLVVLVAICIASRLAATPAALVYFCVDGPSNCAQLHWLYAWQRSIDGFEVRHGPSI